MRQKTRFYKIHAGPGRHEAVCLKCRAHVVSDVSAEQFNVNLAEHAAFHDRGKA